MSVRASRPSESSTLDRLHPDNPASGSPALARIRPPHSLRLVAMALAVALPLLGLLLLIVPWQQSATGAGRVIAFSPQEREQMVEAPISGRIAEWFVQEGQLVQKGDPLVELRDNDPAYIERLREQLAATESERLATEEQISSYTRKLEAARSSRELLISEYDAKIQGTLHKLAGEQAELDTAVLNLNRTMTLADEGIASPRSREVALMKEAKARTTVEARNREISALRRAKEKTAADSDGKIESTRAELEGARSKLSEVRRKMLDLESKTSRQASQVVVAPRDGTVLRLHGGLGGGQMKSGDPVATLVPTTESRAAELWIDGNDMPFITEGAQVRLVFEGWPALQFVGLNGASQGTFGGLVSFIDATDKTGKFRVVVVPDGESEWPDSAMLRQGVRTKGFLLLGRVPLGYELWRQINGFPPLPSVDKGEPSSLPTNKKPRTPAALK